MKRSVVAGIAVCLGLVACSKGTTMQTEGSAVAATQDTVAQSMLRNAVAAARIYWTDGSTYTGFDASSAASIEPALPWVGDQAAASNAVSIDVAEGSQLVLSTRSASGTSFCIADDAGSSTRTGTVDARGATTAAGCAGAAW